MKTTYKIASFLLILIFLKTAYAVEYPDFNNMKDDEVLETIQRNIFNFFWNKVNKCEYLVQDRSCNFGIDRPNPVYSTITSGFGMVAACIGHKRGWISEKEAYKRVDRILTKFLEAPEKAKRKTKGLVHYKGFYYRFLDSNGSRTWNSELTTIDTCFFIASALFAGKYFEDLNGDNSLWEKADKIYQRINWKWMTNKTDYFQWGWKPEKGETFNLGDISGYSEGILAYILAMGSPTYPLDNTDGWNKLLRIREKNDNVSYIGWHVFLVHQYPAFFMDFIGNRDKHMCYSMNTYIATIHQHRHAYDMRNKFSTYGEYSWGLGITDDPDGGCTAYGMGSCEDGTVSLSSLISSINEIPYQVISAVRYLYSKYKYQLWGDYGFTDSYNTDSSKSNKRNTNGMWRDPDVIGVQLASVMIAIENYRSGLIKNTFSKISYIKDSLDKLGFVFDSTPPGKITGFKSVPMKKQVELSWIAPGDDNYKNNITNGLYEIRFTTNSSDTWYNAPTNYLEYETMWSTNTVAGSSQKTLLEDLDEGKNYYFWIRIADDCFNWSPISDKITVKLGS